MSTGRLYVIGDRETGVLFVLTNPLRTFLVERSDIEAEAKAAGKTFDELFADYASGATGAVFANDSADKPGDPAAASDAVGFRIAQGATISDVDFCFVAEVDSERLLASRQSYPPLETALGGLSGESPDGG